jgi:glycosyltransferase involved in cell wall biosynthesis
VTTCQATASELTEATGYPDDRIVVAAPGCTVRGRRTACPVSGRFILAAGVITPRKGFEVLARAVQMLGPFGPPLVIAGPVGYRGDAVLRAVTAVLERDRLVLLGDRYDEMESLYRAATLVCHPSLAEGFGLVCLEAMGAGAPVIAADIPSIREMGDGCIRLVPPNDAHALRDAIGELLVDAAGRERLSELGRARAALYTWESMAARCVDAYRVASDSCARKS